MIKRASSVVCILQYRKGAWSDSYQHFFLDKAYNLFSIKLTFKQKNSNKYLISAMKKAVDVLGFFSTFSIGRSNRVGIASGGRSSFLYPPFFAKAGCVVNWSGVKCLAHNLEYSVTLNPSRRKFRIQILLNFGYFGNRYMDTPLWLRILQLKATHWTILMNKPKNFHY